MDNSVRISGVVLYLGVQSQHTAVCVLYEVRTQSARSVSIRQHSRAADPCDRALSKAWVCGSWLTGIVRVCVCVRASVCECLCVCVLCV